MAVRPVILLLVALTLAGGVSAQSPADSAPPAKKPVAELPARDAVVLGLIEGLTEYLPVSSLGHVMVANHFFGLEGTAQLHDSQGQPLWVRPPQPKIPQGEPLTVKVAADTFTVVTQIGAILAVGILFRSRFAEIIRGLFGRSAEGRRLLLNLVVAFIPAGIVGFLLNRWILQHLYTIPTFIAAQIVGAALMIYAEWWRRRPSRPSPEALEAQALRGASIHLETVPGLDGSRLPLKSALGIGVLQCASFWPGMSRSMTTIVGGYFTGMDGPRSGEFSFLLGFFTLSAASLYKAHQSGHAMIQVFGWPHVILGAAVATVAAMLAVKLFLTYLTRHGLTIFAIYRVAFAIFLGIWAFA